MTMLPKRNSFERVSQLLGDIIRRETLHEQMADPKKERQQSLNKELCEACQKNDQEKVIKLIENGAELNCIVSGVLNEQMPLFICIENDNIEMLGLLIDKGAPISQKQIFDGSTPLHIACSSNKKAFVKLLIEKGADVNSKSKIGRTPLMEAVFMNHTEIVEILLSCPNISLNETDNEQKTCLGYALDNFNPDNLVSYETAKRLIESGAYVNSSGKRPEGVTMLHCAASIGDLEWVKLLIETHEAWVEVRDHKGFRPLDYAERHHHKEVVEFIKLRSKKSCHFLCC